MKRFLVVSKSTLSSRQGPERLGDGGIGGDQCLALAGPVEVIPFARPSHDVIG